MDNFFRAPSFWYEKPGIRSTLLKPIAALYQFISRLCWKYVKPLRLGIPVICVGNVVVGGAGKTPVVQDLARRLPYAHIVSRGYGGSLTGPVRVDPARHTASEVGDEPLMLATHAPVWVGKDRAATAAAAEHAGAKIIIMDDGLQNHSITKTMSLLVMDGNVQTGNGLTLPAGPLREPLDAALNKSSAIVWIGSQPALPQSLPVLRAVPETFCITHQLAGKKLFAFSGIAHPQKFFDGLLTLGGVVMATQRYADHYAFLRAELDAILEEASKLDALPVTTAKDASRIPADLRPHFAVCDVRLKWENEANLTKLLAF